MEVIATGKRGNVLWTEVASSVENSKQFTLSFVKDEELPKILNMLIDTNSDIFGFTSMLDTGRDNSIEIQLLKDATFKDINGVEQNRYIVEHAWINMDNPFSNEPIKMEIFKLTDTIYGTKIVVTPLDPEMGFNVIFSVPKTTGTDVLKRFNIWRNFHKVN